MTFIYDLRHAPPKQTSTYPRATPIGAGYARRIGDTKTSAMVVSIHISNDLEPFGDFLVP
jgi:hypothetical protein